MERFESLVLCYFYAYLLHFLTPILITSGKKVIKTEERGSESHIRHAGDLLEIYIFRKYLSLGGYL